jgi:hypothetical protein
LTERELSHEPDTPHSDERYEAVETLTRERGQTPEEFINTLLDEAWEQAYAK